MGSQVRKLEIRGMYPHPKPFWDKSAKLDDYGVNALFVHAGSITPELMTRASAEGARVFAEFPTLNGKGYVENNPDAWPINERGDGPLDVAGVWMDYFHWHAQF